MEPVDGVDPLVRVTWHIEESLLRWLTDQSRESGVPKAKIARRLLAEGMVRQVLTGSPEVILPSGEFPPSEGIAGWAERKAPVSPKAHRWVGVAKDSPVKHCERCHLTERTWQKHGGQPEVCDG